MITLSAVDLTKLEDGWTVVISVCFIYFEQGGDEMKCSVMSDCM